MTIKGRTPDLIIMDDLLDEPLQPYQREMMKHWFDTITPIEAVRGRPVGRSWLMQPPRHNKPKYKAWQQLVDNWNMAPKK